MWPDCLPQENPGNGPLLSVVLHKTHFIFMIMKKEKRKDTEFKPSLAVEDLEIINLSNNLEIQYPVSIKVSPYAGEKSCTFELLKEYQDVFA